MREMIERVEYRGLDLEEPLELEPAEDEFPKCIKSKITYTRALLLELTEVEVCRKLPNDFDLLLLRQLDGGSDAMVEEKGIIGKPCYHVPLLTNTWNLAFPGERQYNHTQSKESHSQRNCTSEKKEVCQPLLQKPEKDAGVLHCEMRKSDLFQLSKTKNPYRPPHLNKKTSQPIVTSSETGVESLEEFDRGGSVDDIAGHGKSDYDFTLAVADDLTKEPVGKEEAYTKHNEGIEVNEPSKPLDEYADFRSKSEGSVVIGAINVLEEVTEENQPTFDDFWAEILETIHLQQEQNISPTNTHADSEVEIHFPDEESLTSVDPFLVPEYSTNFDVDDCSGVANSEDDINLPDEDSLITIQDLMAPYSSMLTLNSASWEADEVTSNIAVDTRKNSRSANVAKKDDHSKRIRLKSQGCPDFSGLAASRHLHSPPPHSQTGFPPLFLTSNNLSYMPSLNNSTQSKFNIPFYPESTVPNTKANNLISQYSMFHQPNIYHPQQPNHLLFDTTCAGPVNLQTMQFLPPTPQQAIYESFGKLKAGK